MKKVINEFEELRESRELLTAREPSFIIIITFLVILLLITSFIWMWRGKVDVVVRAEGIVRPHKNVSIIRNIYDGKIKKIYFIQGKEVEKSEPLLEMETSSLKEKRSYFLRRVKKIEKNINNLILFKKSIVNNTSFPEEKTGYHNRYLLYKIEYRQLKIALIKAEDRYNRGKKLTSFSTTESELKKLKLNYENARLNLSKFKRENINNINGKINNLQIKLLELKSELIDINKRVKASRIKAPISGKLEVMQKLNPGDYIPAGQEIVKIVPHSELSYKMVIMVKNRDISKLKPGQKIRYRFHSLPYREYGVLTGEITKIACDTTEGEKQSNFYYEVVGSIRDKKLINDNGKIKYIKTGMLSEVRIITGRKKILYYVLEKLDFLD